MKFLLDLFPVIVFFVAFKLANIYVATGLTIAATFIQMAISWLKNRKIEPMQWISLILVSVFGGATIFFHDESFIKWKPTILYLLFAGVLLLSPVVAKKNLIEAMMSAQIKLPMPVWAKLNQAWGLFFIVMAAANYFVASNYPTDIWVNFKLFGATGMMLVFMVAQGFYLTRHMEEES
ncbi:septation protein A [Ampullimonas aquatilis]|uniref:septation protein A n=1 Tax=Ampullimonas aquatilis TaxID=1341549 RepID=UPI003C716D8E